MSRQPFHLHIGLPKTGTKTLQLGIFPHLPNIQYMGRMQLKQDEEPGLRSFLSDLERANTFDEAAAARLFHTNILSRVEAGRAGLWSEEALSCMVPDATPRFARRLASLDHPIRVLMVVRAPLDILESTYFHVIKRLNAGSPPPHLVAVAGHPPAFISFDAWVAFEWARPYRGMLHRLAVSRIASAYESALGRDHLHVARLEDLARRPAIFAEQIAGFLSADPALTRNVVLSAERQNSRYHSGCIDLLQKISADPAEAERFRNAPVGTRRRLFQASSGNCPPARAQLSPVWQDMVLQEFAGEYQSLFARFGLDRPTEIA